MNNMDIRCGELQSVMVNINYWEQVWSEFNDDIDITYRSGMKETFHKELNDKMVNAYERGLDHEHKYFIVDNLVQEYINMKWIIIEN